MRKRLSPFGTFGALSAIWASAAVPALAAQTLAKTPEQELARISQGLKPISDDIWKEVAGTRIEEKYEVVAGDTLYSISKRLFDDSKYWPKIWSFNNSSIRNPHRIRPGMILAFQGAGGGSLPSLGASQNSEVTSDAPNGAAPVMPQSGEDFLEPEWKRLPKQRWEISVSNLGPLVDREGLDQKKARIQGKIAEGIEMEAFAASDKISLLGQITGARSESTGMTLGDTLYIEAEDRLEIGETYSITQEPAVLKARKSDRSGYSYPLLGQVQILGLKDGLYLGRVTQARGTIRRGHDLIRRVDKLKLPSLKAADRPLQAVLMFDKNLSTFATAQNKTVFVDRGARDGIQKGMVFRAYQYFDPSDDHEVTESDFIIDADILVIDVTDDFCTGIVLSSFSTILENSTVVLLTDISDVRKRAQFRARTQEEVQRDQELDELEQLPPEDDEALSEAERKEIERLEKWKENPEGADPEALPPPPAESLENTDAPLESPIEEPTDQAPIDQPPEPEAPSSGEEPPALDEPAPPSDETPPPPEEELPAEEPAPPAPEEPAPNTDTPTEEPPEL